MRMPCICNCFKILRAPSPSVRKIDSVTSSSSLLGDSLPLASASPTRLGKALDSSCKGETLTDTRMWLGQAAASAHARRRQEERRVGEEGGSPCSVGGSPEPAKKHNIEQINDVNR